MPKKFNNIVHSSFLNCPKHVVDSIFPPINLLKRKYYANIANQLDDIKNDEQMWVLVSSCLFHYLFVYPMSRQIKIKSAHFASLK